MHSAYILDHCITVDMLYSHSPVLLSYRKTVLHILDIRFLLSTVVGPLQKSGGLAESLILRELERESVYRPEDTGRDK